MQRSPCSRASARCWTAFRPHRDVRPRFGISAAVHLLILFGIGSAIYESGEDDKDIPELSVQLETREGPNDEEFTEAALPQPAPDPVEEVVDDPGTSEQTLDAPMLADATPMQEQIPDVAQIDESAAFVEPAPAAGAVLTTTADSATQVPLVAEPEPEGAAEVMPQPEQVMLTRNMQQVAHEAARHQHHGEHHQLAAGRPAILRARHAPARAPTAPASNR